MNNQSTLQNSPSGDDPEDSDNDTTHSSIPPAAFSDNNNRQTTQASNTSRFIPRRTSPRRQATVTTYGRRRTHLSPVRHPRPGLVVYNQQAHGMVPRRWHDPRQGVPTLEEATSILENNNDAVRFLIQEGVLYNPQVSFFFK